MFISAITRTKTWPPYAAIAWLSATRYASPRPAAIPAGVIASMRARPRSVPMWIIGIGFRPAKSWANGDPQLLPCPQPRKMCRTWESWPVWRSNRSA